MQRASQKQQIVFLLYFKLLLLLLLLRLLCHAVVTANPRILPSVIRDGGKGYRRLIMLLLPTNLTRTVMSLNRQRLKLGGNFRITGRDDKEMKDRDNADSPPATLTDCKLAEIAEETPRNKEIHQAYTLFSFSHCHGQSNLNPRSLQCSIAPFNIFYML